MHDSRQTGNGGRQRYRPLTARNIQNTTFWNRLPRDAREAIRVVSQVLPFRSNEYVLEELIDADRIPDDSVVQLTFAQRGMLDPSL